jgi:hypothetical protein
LLIRLAIVAGAAVVWFAGLRLFLQSELSRRRKVLWTAFLVLVGLAIGVILPSSQLWNKFLLLVVILPLLGFSDVVLFRSKRGLLFWIRACGFEICTVFGAAGLSRFGLDVMGVTALIAAVN